MGEMSGSHHASPVSRSVLLNRMLLAVKDKVVCVPQVENPPLEQGGRRGLALSWQRLKLRLRQFVSYHSIFMCLKVFITAN